MGSLCLIPAMKGSTQMLCAAKLSTAIVVSYSPRVKLVEACEMILNYGLVYFINREKPHEPIS